MPKIQWDAADYEKHSAQQHLWARELIQKLALRGDEIVLDLGCGDGKITAELAASLPDGSVLGVDLSAEMIALAQQRYPASLHKNLRFQQADASRLSFQAQFSLTFSNAVLHWIRDQAPVLQGIARALKPGGKILLQMGGRGNAAQVVSCVERLIHQPAWAEYFVGFEFPYGFYDPEEYSAWLREAGLVPLRAELLPREMRHAGPSGLSGWIRTTWMPYTQRVPAQLRDRFVDELVQAYLADHPLDDQGSARVQMVRLEVEAFRPLPAKSG